MPGLLLIDTVLRLLSAGQTAAITRLGGRKVLVQTPRRRRARR